MEGYAARQQRQLQRLSIRHGKQQPITNTDRNQFPGQKKCLYLPFVEARNAVLSGVGSGQGRNRREEMRMLQADPANRWLIGSREDGFLLPAAVD